MTGSARCRVNTTCSAKFPRSARGMASTKPRSPSALHVLGRTEAIRRRSAGHDRRAHHHPLQSRQAVRRSGRVRNGDQPRADRAARCSGRCFTSPIPMATGSPRASANSRSPRRLDFKTAVTTRPGMIFPGKRRIPDRAAAGFPQRQFSGRTHPPRFDLRRRHRGVERLSADRRGVTGRGGFEAGLNDSSRPDASRIPRMARLNVASWTLRKAKMPSADPATSAGTLRARSSRIL